MAELLAKIPKPIRDAIEGLFAVVVVYLLTFADGYLAANPAAFGSATAIIVVALGIVRRWLVPVEPTPVVKTYDSYPSYVSLNADIDRPTPALGTPHVMEFAPRTAEQTISRDDDDFIMDCVHRIPQPANGVKSFSPAVLASILIWLFQHRADIMALIENAKTAWLKFLALWRLRSAIRQAVKAGAGHSSEAQEQPIEKWLLKADTGTLIRFGRIAAMRPRA